MGQILDQIYGIVEAQGGTAARIKLATITGLSKKDAAEMKDEPELIKKCKAVADEILGGNINDFLKK